MQKMQRFIPRFSALAVQLRFFTTCRQLLAPPPADSSFARGQKLAMSGDHKGAANAFKLALTETIDGVTEEVVKIEILSSLIAMGNFDEALREAQAAINAGARKLDLLVKEKQQGDTNLVIALGTYHLLAGRALLKKGKAQEADDILQVATKMLFPLLNSLPDESFKNVEDDYIWKLVTSCISILDLRAICGKSDDAAATFWNKAIEIVDKLSAAIGKVDSDASWTLRRRRGELYLHRTALLGRIGAANIRSGKCEEGVDLLYGVVEAFTVLLKSAKEDLVSHLCPIITPLVAGAVKLKKTEVVESSLATFIGAISARWGGQWASSKSGLPSVVAQTVLSCFACALLLQEVQGKAVEGVSLLSEIYEGLAPSLIGGGQLFPAVVEAQLNLALVSGRSKQYDVALKYADASLAYHETPQGHMARGIALYGIKGEAGKEEALAELQKVEMMEGKGNPVLHRVSKAIRQGEELDLAPAIQEVEKGCFSEDDCGGNCSSCSHSCTGGDRKPSPDADCGGCC